MRPATNNQKKALDNLGISYSRRITFKEAHGLISKRVAEIKSQRASNSGSSFRSSFPKRDSWYSSNGMHSSGFPIIGPPGGTVRDFLGGEACYNMWGGIESVFLPNFGEVDVWDDDGGWY